MGLFQRIFQPDRNKQADKALRDADGYFKTLTAYQPAFRDWRGEIYESELVRAAIDARARHISKLAITIQGAAQPALQTKLRQGPNQWQTWSQFMYRLSTILDIHNTAFVTPVFDEDLRVTGYFTALPTECELLQYKGEPWLRYRFRQGMTAAVELRRVAILTKFQHRDDFFGTSNHALDDTMKLLSVQRQGIEEYAKNSATYRFLAQVSNFTKASDLANERKRFSEENLSAEADAGGLLLFPNTYQNIQQIKQNNFEIDAEQIKIIQTNVFNYFGVNEDILENRATGDAWSAFYEGAIEPFSIQFSESMTKAIFTERERASGALLMATANRLQYMSNADKLNVSAQMADRGIMSINEIREIWNLPPVEGGDIRIARGEYKDAGGISDGGTQDETEPAV